jgi:zinc-finger of acetyl-transferase ESCO
MEWAKNYYQHWDGHKRTCPVCGMNFVAEDEGDRRLHRKWHREIVTTFDPKPNVALKRRRISIGEDFIPIRWGDPKWLHKRLYLIAKVLQHENGYDFPMWSAAGTETGGFLIVDGDGRALGGFAVRLAQPTRLRWIWIAPPYRRQGWLRRSWGMLTARFPGILPEPPFSPAAEQFFKPLLLGMDGARRCLSGWIGALFEQKGEMVQRTIFLRVRPTTS